MMATKQSLPKSVRAALYLRVSTSEQTTDNQEVALREVAAHCGHLITKVYRDHGVSGAKGRDKRPQFDAMLKDASRRKFNVVMAWSVDRVSRSLTDLLEFLREIHALKVDLYLHTQGIDTTTPTGRAMFQMMGVFGELERSLIQERIKAGLDRARASGKRLGRPGISDEVVANIQQLLTQGLTIVEVAREARVGTSTVERVKRRSV